MNGEISTVGYGENSTVLATFGELDTALVNVSESHEFLNISGRYSVEGSHNATSFDYKFTTIGESCSLFRFRFLKFRLNLQQLQTLSYLFLSFFLLFCY